MTPETAKKWLPIIQAVAEGHTIQKWERTSGPGLWMDCPDIESVINWCPDFLQVKPAPRKPSEFWIVKEIDGPFIGVFGDGQLAGKVASGNRKIIHVREVIDE